MIKIVEKLGVIRKAKNTSFRFGALIISIFFYVQNTLPVVGDVVWDKTMSMTK